MPRSLAFMSRGARESRTKASEDAKGACASMGVRISSLMESVDDPALREDPHLRSVVLELQRALGGIDPLLKKMERRLETSVDSEPPRPLAIPESSPKYFVGVSPGGSSVEDGGSSSGEGDAGTLTGTRDDHHVLKGSAMEIGRTKAEETVTDAGKADEIARRDHDAVTASGESEALKVRTKAPGPLTDHGYPASTNLEGTVGCSSGATQTRVQVCGDASMLILVIV